MVIIEYISISFIKTPWEKPDPKTFETASLQAKLLLKYETFFVKFIFRLNS